MSNTIEGRSHVVVRRPSDALSFGFDTSEYTTSLPDFQQLQSAHVAARYGVSPSLARLIAELAFNQGRSR